MGDQGEEAAMTLSEELQSKVRRRLSRVLENRRNDVITPGDFGYAVSEILYMAICEGEHMRLAEADALACLEMVPVEFMKEVAVFIEWKFRPFDFVVDFPPVGGPATVLSEAEHLRRKMETRRRLIAIDEKVRGNLSKSL
jgi:hypothetical protein